MFVALKHIICSDNGTFNRSNTGVVRQLIFLYERNGGYFETVASSEKCCRLNNVFSAAIIVHLIAITLVYLESLGREEPPHKGRATEDCNIQCKSITKR